MLTIFDIKRFAVHDGPGIRTTVFLKGCPLRCWWCHNPESQSMEPFTVDIERKLNGKTIMATKTYGESVEETEVMEVVLRDRHFYEESGGGVTFSGGEPLMQTNALVSLLQSCELEGIHTALDTSGFATRDQIDRVLPHTGLFLYDLKHMDETLHRKYTGVEKKLILSNADYLLGKGARVIFRIPVIPGINTPRDDTDRFISFLEERREVLDEVHLLPYHRIAENKYFRLRMKQKLSDVKEPDPTLMKELRERFESAGLVVSIGG
jgi:pyruvate formate lyase activating enzyme